MSSRSSQLQQLWIDAFHDSRANLQTFTYCMTLADLNADGNYKLILADLGNGSTHVKLKVYSGTNLASEVPLLDAPSALVSLYTDNNEPHIPGIAVSCGSNVLVYRNSRPYFKFSLPMVDGSSLEADIWRQKSEVVQLVRLLQDLSKEIGYSNLSAPSQMLLALEHSAREEFAFKHRHCSIKKQTVITCMTTLRKSVADDETVSCIVLGTESNQLFILDPEAFTIADTFPLKFVPYLINASGLYSVDYRVLLVSLTGAVAMMRAGVVCALTQLPACPVSVVQVSRTFVSANMDDTLQCYSLKGVKQWSVSLPGSPVVAVSVPLNHKALQLVAVAVRMDTGGCVLLYSGPQLMHSFVTAQYISSLVFGRYGREEHALVSVSEGGALSVKLLKRTAQFGSGERPAALDKPHNIKLLVPKKSKLFVEQTIREREQYKDIHRWFHRAWLGLSVAASEAYIKALRSATVCQREALKLTAQVVGLGPKLKVQMFLENLATDYVPAGLAVSILYDNKTYTVHKPYIPVPMLVPGLSCCLETLVTCHTAVVGQLTVLVFARKVLLSAVINMPPGKQGNRGSLVVDTRTVQIGKCDNKSYPDNRVISYKGVIPDSPVSSWATLGPLMIVVSVSAVKQGYEDYLRHKADRKINNSLVTVVRGGVAQEITCKKVCVGDIVRVSQDSDIPCDLVMLISSHPDSKGYITTSNLDGETNLKTVECPLDTDLTVDHLHLLQGTIACDAPTVDLYQFHGNITLSLTEGEGDLETFNPVFIKDGYELENLHGDSCRGRHRCSFSKLHFLSERVYSAPLTASNLLLRGSRLRNTEYVYGCAVYTGQETKLALNSTIQINKFSTIEKSINNFLVFFFLLLLIEVLLSVTLMFFSNTYFNDSNRWYLAPQETFTSTDFVFDIFMFIVLYYYIIPISLYVTIEGQRLIGTLFFEWDLEMFSNDHPAVCNTSDLNEELGQLQYLFSDKTGTLTENNMQFRRCSIEGSVYCESQGQLLLLPPCGSLVSAITLPHWPPEVEQFMLSMALCHSVQTVSELSGKQPPATGTPQYQASSPDEKALVEAAARCGVVFRGLEAGFLTVSVKGEIRKYKKLLTLEFSSDRKRMSVVVSDVAERVWLLCKGADASMMPLMVSGHREETMRHFTDFSMRGLRTLVFGWRVLDSGQYQRLARSLRLARSQLDPSLREAQLNAVCDGFEQQLHLQGATAVEDRLQDRVPETLELLRTAGIKIWVLTGDKVETALNIAYSCGHFKSGTRRLDLTDKNNETDCIRTLQDLKHHIAGESLAQYGLVVDGPSLRLALRHDRETLRYIALQCHAVLCCRLSPKQKAELVSLVKKSDGRPIVAAVGDGANDVSMIQEANVGFGIVGKEGLQAVRCSDFAFAKFHCLARAVLVHGQWYYLRAATLVQYFFYKNIVFITPQVYFSLLNGVSPQALYLSVFLVLYNTIFTAAPVFTYSLFEQNYAASVLLSRPELYKLYRHNRFMSWPYFTQWILLGVWHSVVVYFVPATWLSINPVVLANNTSLDFKAFGTTILHNIVLVVNLKLWLHSTFWSPLFLLSLVTTIATFIVFCCIYNVLVLESTSHSMYYVYFQLLKSINFWLLSLLTVVLSLMPDLVIRIFQSQKFRRPQLPSWLPTHRRGTFILPTLETSSTTT